MFLQSSIDEDIKNWLKEDIPSWDPHASSISEEQEVKASIIAKQNGKISGISVLKRVFELCNVQISINVNDGSFVEEGISICDIVGNPISILQAERTALNIFTHMSGITSMTAKMVEIVKKANSTIKIAGTRKTLPGLRKYQKYAIYCGGGDTHRMNLDSMIMLKENHLSQFNSITEAIQAYKSKTSFSLKIEVEARTLEGALEAAKQNVDIIMLDNFNLSTLGETVRQIKSVDQNVLIEISGRVSIDNIAEYIKYPIDIISSGALTHSNTVFDASLLFDDLI